MTAQHLPKYRFCPVTTLPPLVATTILQVFPMRSTHPPSILHLPCRILKAQIWVYLVFPTMTIVLWMMFLPLKEKKTKVPINNWMEPPLPLSIVVYQYGKTVIHLSLIHIVMRHYQTHWSPWNSFLYRMTSMMHISFHWRIQIQSLIWVMWQCLTIHNYQEISIDRCHALPMEAVIGASYIQSRNTLILSVPLSCLDFLLFQPTTHGFF